MKKNLVIYFSVNEKNYGVKSTFKSSLEGYTIPISADKNSEEYRKMEAQALKTVQEILESKRTNSDNKPTIKLENGDEKDCICNRQNFSVICQICGSYMASTRIRKICSVHPAMYLEFLDEEIDIKDLSIVKNYQEITCLMGKSSVYILCKSN